MLMKTTDGTPDAVKVARPVWDRGKGGDYIKTLPIVISRKTLLYSVDCIYLVRSTGGRTEFRHAD